MAKPSDMTDAEWKEEILKIVKDLRQVRKALENEPIPPGLAKYLSPDDPPPTSTPGAAALRRPSEMLELVGRRKRGRLG